MNVGKFLLRFCTPLVHLLFPFKTIGKEHIPPETPDSRIVLCCNHISELDPMFLEMCQRRHIYFMAKEELFHNKLSAWLFGNQLGAFPVRRGKGDTGAIDTAKSIVESGKMLGIFPEGTRSRDGKLGRGKSGAALIVSQTGAEVLPACIVTKDQHVRLFRRSKVVFGPPISLEELHLENPEHPDLRYASRLIMERIGRMIEENR